MATLENRTDGDQEESMLTPSKGDSHPVLNDTTAPMMFCNLTPCQFGISVKSFTPGSSLPNHKDKSRLAQLKARRRSSVGVRGSPETNSLIRFMAQQRMKTPPPPGSRTPEASTSASVAAREGQGAAAREGQGAAAREGQGAAAREGQGAAAREGQGAAAREGQGAAAAASSSRQRGTLSLHQEKEKGLLTPPTHFSFSHFSVLLQQPEEMEPALRPTRSAAKSAVGKMKCILSPQVATRRWSKDVDRSRYGRRVHVCKNPNLSPIAENPSPPRVTPTVQQDPPHSCTAPSHETHLNPEFSNDTQRLST
ncbi:hypothetical protein KUCAC02_029125 [Chaenocephalus aceratus]|uniref:Uncharacterized protein n=1 Tax=Chaenocephalus aceratus TaxID=36190 RepID=A0ACB9X523_CHAAC|nr:hypothetical protein KUCAC02_029125 [Chaenocephalus aceratus]